MATMRRAAKAEKQARKRFKDLLDANALIQKERKDLAELADRNLVVFYGAKASGKSTVAHTWIDPANVTQTGGRFETKAPKTYRGREVF